MSEIKFKYIYQHDITKNIVVKIHTLDDIEVGHWYYDHMTVIARKRYTGLKDKNEKESYEDDIVRAIGFNPEYHRIEFVEGGFCLTHPKSKGFPIDINILYPSIGCQMEIVGNFYENSDLLK